MPRIVLVARREGGLKLAAYSCARDMQVSCPGGVAGSECETVAGRRHRRWDLASLP